MKPFKGEKFILGIDLGANSLGWALIRPDGKKPRLIGAGSRVFDAGMENMEQDGKGVSRNLQRRQARAVRRLLERRARRLGKAAGLLQRAGLFPEGALKTGEERHELLTKLDGTLPSPYVLRARALDENLSPQEIGRALYHLAQRRGFLSNRKAPPKKEERGPVKEGIGDLAQKMSEAGARTLGEYLSRLNPMEERLRTRYTSRQMYEDEFEKIWEKQKEHHPTLLTEDAKRTIHKAIFHQRPLKNQKHLIGRCELEPEHRRAPWALLISQRFRYLQRLNDLRIVDDGRFRELSAEEREKLEEALEGAEELSFARARRILKLPRDSRFNLESGGEKKIPGNRTAAKLRDLFTARWESFSEQERERIVEDLRSVEKEETLKRRGMIVWGLDEKDAGTFSQMELEEGYCRFSKEAMKKLLPLLKAGKPLASAIKELYPERWEHKGQAKDSLPPVKSPEFAALRNPIVERSLTELRKAVNAVIRTHGKPGLIRIEMARELRQPAKQREESWKRMRRNEKVRKEAAEKILRETNIKNPKRADIEKVLLAEECGWTCPYTGRRISMKALLGEHPQFDVEHILPFPRSLDDSMLNKTLCHAEENRKVKHNKTPFEAYGKTEKWPEILGRVKNFKGNARDEKLRRFQFTSEDLEEFLDGFTQRQLNDTRYAARRAKEYLGVLYGGVNDDGLDEDGKRRVQTCTGQATAFLRSVWGLNAVLGDGPGKSRDDHRHHAVDAVAIALTDPGTVKMLSDAAKRAQREKRRRFGKVVPPWEGFSEEVREAIGKITVSHRVSKKVRGALHQETFYEEPRTATDGKRYVHVRRPLSALLEKDLDNIVDPVVRTKVKTKLQELGNDLKKFSDPKNHPHLESAKGQKIPIHRVRLRQNLEAIFPVGKGERARYVQGGANHHMEEVEDRASGKWEGHVVSLFEAHRRLRSGEPIVRREHGAGKKFLFSLACGEIIQLDLSDGQRGLFVVRTVPLSKQVRFIPIQDARKLKDISKEGQTGYPETLRKRNCRKVTVGPLGEVRDAHD